MIYFTFNLNLKEETSLFLYKGSKVLPNNSYKLDIMEKILLIKCECCGQYFWTTEPACYCVACEAHWNED